MLNLALVMQERAAGIGEHQMLLLAKMYVREFRPEYDREGCLAALRCAAPGDRRGLATGRGPSE